MTGLSGILDTAASAHDADDIDHAESQVRAALAAFPDSIEAALILADRLRELAADG